MKRSLGPVSGWLFRWAHRQTGRTYPLLVRIADRIGAWAFKLGL